MNRIEFKGDSIRGSCKGEDRKTYRLAKGKQKKKSDIDILVDLKKPLGLDFIKLTDRLEERLGKKVDVATFDCYRRSFNNPRYKHIAEDIKKSLLYV